MGAYEVLWSDPQATFKSLSKRFAEHPGSVPSDFVPREAAIASAAFVKQRFAAASISPVRRPRSRRRQVPREAAGCDPSRRASLLPGMVGPRGVPLGRGRRDAEAVARRPDPNAASRTRTRQRRLHRRPHCLTKDATGSVSLPHKDATQGGRSRPPGECPTTLLSDSDSLRLCSPPSRRVALYARAFGRAVASP